MVHVHKIFQIRDDIWDKFSVNTFSHVYPKLITMKVIYLFQKYKKCLLYERIQILLMFHKQLDKIIVIRQRESLEMVENTLLIALYNFLSEIETLFLYTV